MSVLDKVRRWIDGESAELVLEEAARNAQVAPRSLAEEFIVKIARAVEEVMQREMVPLPQGTTIIPCEYMIFLSEADDKEWQGAKRRGLEQGLYHILAERAREIAGKRKLETKTFAVELRVDGTLQKEEIRVQHSWEDSNSSKTGVLSRAKLPKEPPSTQKTSPTPYQAPQDKNYEGHPTPFTGDKTHAPPTFSGATLPTKQSFDASAYISESLPPVSYEPEESEEMTRINSRQMPLFKIEIWRGGVRQNVLPIYKNEVIVGRGSKSKPVDIMLTGDPEVSRRHLVLSRDAGGNYSVINEGRNPAMINNAELPIGQRITVSSGTPITVCSYLIRIQ